MRLAASVALVLIVSVATAFAASDKASENGETKKQYVYEWTDVQGGVHITDDLGDVPKRYRAKARKREMPKGQAVGPSQPPTGGAGFPSDTMEARQKAAWQQRLRLWKERLAVAESRYRDLDEQRQDALRNWGGIASGRREGIEEAERLEQQMKDVQKEIDKAKNMIDVVIPEEARKAGVPPGWLRE